MRTNTLQLFISATLTALAALAFGTQPAQADVTEAWSRHYNHTVRKSDDIAYKVVTDAAGDIIVTGTTSSYASGRDDRCYRGTGLKRECILSNRWHCQSGVV